MSLLHFLQNERESFMSTTGIIPILAGVSVIAACEPKNSDALESGQREEICGFQLRR